LQEKQKAQAKKHRPGEDKGEEPQYETQIWNARAQAEAEAEAAAKAAGSVSRSSSTHEPASSSSNKAHMEVEHYTTKDGMYDL